MVKTDLDQTLRYFQVKDAKETIELFRRYKKVKLKSGSEYVGNSRKRQWYEIWKGKKGIVIQRFSGHPWAIFFIDGDIVRTPSYRAKNHSGKWVDVMPVFTSVEQAVDFLKSTFGINAEV